jgi:beta-phosphoglucomutase-like phosphatase (HAD superfamily)
MRVDNVRVIILDFDGVILESNEVKTAAFVEVFARFPEHAEAMMAFHEANVSASRFVKFDHLLRERLGRPDDSDLRAELAADFSRRSLQLLAKAPFVPGARAFLEEFAARVPLYLASVTPQEDLEITLGRRGLREYFRAVYGCPPWTKPDAVRAALNRERCPASRAVLVGDSPGDLRAAEETGVEFVWRDSGLALNPSVPTKHQDLHDIADHLRARLT